jgi:gliding motility-associated-like protein
LSYATFFGGTSLEHVDGGTSRFSPDGTIYQAICAGCGRQGYPTMPSDVWSTVNNSSNCNLAALKIAFQLGEVQLDADVQPRSGCAPLTLQITNNSSNAQIVLWDFDDGSPIDTRLVPTKTYTQPGNYRIKLVVADTLCGTIDSAFYEIVVRTPDSTGIDFTYNQNPCDVTQPVTFTYQGFPTDSILWNFGDGQFSTALNPTHTYANAGNYTVVLTVFDSICNGLVTFSRELNFQTNAPFEGIQSVFDYCSNPWVVRLAAPYLGFQEVNWDMGNGEQISGREVDYRYTEPGTYTITLVIRDTICNRTFTETLVLNVGDYDLENFLPNVFTPNADGINDFWQLANPEALIRYPGFHLKLYNRWGNLVFETSEPQFRWPGTLAGNALAEGVFFWVVELEDVCGNGFERKGTLTLSR